MNHFRSGMNNFRIYMDDFRSNMDEIRCYLKDFRSGMRLFRSDMNDFRSDMNDFRFRYARPKIRDAWLIVGCEGRKAGGFWAKKPMKPMRAGICAQTERKDGRRDDVWTTVEA